MDLTLPLDALSPIRKQYWSRLAGLPWPKLDVPSEIALRKKISLDTIQSKIWPECRSSVLVFVDGYFDETLSNISALPDSFVQLPIDQATRT